MSYTKNYKREIKLEMSKRREIKHLTCNIQQKENIMKVKILGLTFQMKRNHNKCIFNLTVGIFYLFL